MKLRTIQGILLGVVIGIAVGIGAYTFAYARGWSYLTDDAAACANCHVMREQFTASRLQRERFLAAEYSRLRARGTYWPLYPNIEASGIVRWSCERAHNERIKCLPRMHPYTISMLRASSRAELCLFPRPPRVGHVITRKDCD